MFSIPARNIFKGLLIGIIIGFAGTLVGLSPYGAAFERSVGLALLFNIRGEISPPDEVAIVAIDNRTGEQLGLPSLPRDWPRSIHATLVDSLVNRGASVIVFDVHFHKPKSQHHDQQFVDSVARADRVVLVEQVNGKRQPIFNAEGKIVGRVWSEELLQPFPHLALAAKGLGTFTLPKTEAAVYGFWVFKESVGHAPTLPATALHLYSTLERPAGAGINEKRVSNQFQNVPVGAEDASKAELLLDDMKTLRAYYSDQSAVYQGEISGSLTKISPALQRMYRGPGYRYINFYGPPGTIRTVPYHAVIKGSDPNVPDSDLDFTGKVVFVGYSDLFDPGQPDRFYTVFTQSDGIDLSGVEIAATAFANLLNAQSLKLPQGFQGPIMLFVFGLVVGLLAYLLPAVFGIPLVLTLTGLYVFYTQSTFNSDANWLPLATPVLVQLPIALFLGLFGQYFFERQRGQQFRQALNYYLPESAVKQLTQKSVHDPDSFNKVVYSTCFATDMAGFSSIAEKLSPGDLALMLNDYFDTLAASLNKHGVDVTEFRADAIMCAWTAEKSNAIIRKQPILAALEAADGMQAFKQRYEIFNTDLRVGLEAGTIYIGHAGGGGHFVFSIVGDCANTASRIEGLNKHIGTQILATKTVIDGLDGLLVRYIGDFLFVNKTETTPVYEIISTQEKASSDQFSLCERFAVALQSFHLGEWKTASNLFEDILQDYPDEGPSRFLLNRSVQYQNGAKPPDNPRVIHMDAK